MQHKHRCTDATLTQMQHKHRCNTNTDATQTQQSITAKLCHMPHNTAINHNSKHNSAVSHATQTLPSITTQLCRMQHKHCHQSQLSCVTCHTNTVINHNSKHNSVVSHATQTLSSITAELCHMPHKHCHQSQQQAQLSCVTCNTNTHQSQLSGVTWNTNTVINHNSKHNSVVSHATQMLQSKSLVTTANTTECQHVCKRFLKYC